MATLTETSILTRRIIRYTVYGILGLIMGRSVLLTGIKVYRYFFPLPPTPPSVAFGKLPKLPFPEKQKVEGITYSLETPEGGFPKFNYQAKVYLMPKPFSQLLSLDSAKVKASKLGFSPDGAEVTDTIYKFRHLKVPSEIKISIVSGSFSIGYDLIKDPLPLLTKPMAEDVATSKARSILTAASLMAEDLSGPIYAEYVKVTNNKIVGTISRSEANFTKINFTRKKYDELPAVTNEPRKGNVWLILSGDTDSGKQLIAAEYRYYPVDESKSETYPIKTAESAWNDLITGNNIYIASLGENAGNNIIIRRIYLAYYDPGVAIDFYQPVIVFEGDRDFFAYTPAVISDWISN